MAKLRYAKMHSTKVRFMVAFVVIAALLAASFSGAGFFSVRAATGLSITLNVDPFPGYPNVDVGQVVTYRIDFSCSGLGSDCGQFTITDPFDANLTNLIVVSVPSGFTSSITGNTVTINTDNLLDGETGEVVIQARVKIDAQYPATIPNTATGTIAATGQTTPTNTITLTLKQPNPTGKWQVTKNKTSPSINPTTDNPVDFQICLKPTTQLGNSTLTNVTITDTIPAASHPPNGLATVINADGGTVSGNTITWTLTPAEVQTAFTNNSCVTRNITLQFDTAAGFQIGDTGLQNTASASSTEVANIGPGTATFNLITAQPVPSVSKSIAGNPVSITNGLGRFFLHADTSAANVPINTLVLRDDLPLNGSNVPYLIVTAIHSGLWSPSTPQALVEYSTDAGANWTPLGTVDGTANTTWTTFSGLVTNIRWTFASGVPLGWGMTTNPEVDFKANTAIAVAGTTYTNCLTPIYNNTTGTAACAGADIENSVVNVSPSKTVTGNNFAPEDDIPFTLTLNVTERSDPSVNLTNPQIVDQLPPELTFVSASAPTYNLANCPGSTVGGTPTFTNTGGAGSTLTWAWSGGQFVKPPASGNCSIVINFLAKVNPFVVANTYHNTASFTTSQSALHCEQDTDNNDANGCQQDSPFKVRATAVLNSQKWIVNPNISVPPDETSDSYFFNTSNNTDNDPQCPKYGPGDSVAPDVPYTRFPCVAKGYPANANTPNPNDSKFNYKLVILNTGNVTGDGYYLYDILPHTGDTGVDGALNSSPRDSQFEPIMTGPLVVGSIPANITSITVEYNLTYDPNRPEVDVTTGNNTWYTAATLPNSDWSAVKSFRIRFGAGDTLQAGQKMIFMVSMQINKDAQGGQIAWNSFAHTIRSQSTGLYLPAAEPRKVGIMVPKRMSIGNRVWLDNGVGGGTANNGVQDGSEAGVANVAVTLYRNNAGNPGAVVATTTTDANGYYLFDFDQTVNHPLDAGQYIVGIDKSNWASGGPLQDSISSTTTFNNNTDKNDNGIDQSAPATTGVFSNVITLTLDSTPTGETDKSGNTTPPHDDGPASQGRFGQTDNNSDLTVDFGFYIPMSIGNQVWLDEGVSGVGRNNGIKDAGEPGIGGVTLSLYRAGNLTTPIKTTTTDANGFYLFDGLIPGDYVVGIDKSNFDANNPLAKLVDKASSYPFPNPAFGPNSVVANDNKDHGIDDTNFAANGIFSNAITLTLNSEPVNENPQGPKGNGTNTEIDKNSDQTIDFGFYIPKMSIGNRVWLDTGGIYPNNNPALGNNATEDTVEKGIANVSVSLYTDNNSDNIPDGAAIKTTTTDNNGFYLFDDLSAGRYIVGLDKGNFNVGNPLNDLVSSTGAPNTDMHDNAADTIDATYGLISRVVTLAIQQQPTGETELSNNANDGPNFIGNQGQFDFDSDLTVDFGLYRPMSIGNRVWLDDGAGNGTIRDGIQNGGESGINGVTVRLYADNGDGIFNPNTDTPIGTSQQTRNGGYYLFDGLVEGNYFVWVDKSNFNTGGPLITYDTSPLFQPSNADDQQDHGGNANGTGEENYPATNGVVSHLIQLTHSPTQPTNETDLSGDTTNDGPNSRGKYGETDANSNLVIDFGFAPPVFSIGNRVWFDTNNSRVIDAGDGANPGLSGVTVNLYRDTNNDGTPDGAAIATDTTDAKGYYLFDNLTAGTYIVELDQLNFRSGGPLVDMYSSTGTAAQPNAVDSDDKGIDNTNPQVGGIRSRQFTLVKNNEPINDTDLSGNPTDGPFSRGNQGQLDSNSNLTIDFGLYKPMSIGNRVWYDGDSDGQISGTETGVPGVTVELYAADNSGNPSGAPLATRVTDSKGYYLFDNLVPGNYVVVVAASNFTTGNPLAGLNSSSGVDATNADSHDKGIDIAVPQGIRSNVITLTLGSEPTNEADLSGNTANDGPSSIGRNGETDSDSNLTVDFGFTAGKMSLGNRVWLDRNNNGQIDAGETFIANVAVSLYRDLNSDGIPDGPAIKTTTTNANGYYLFTSLTPGQYVVGLDNSNFNAGKPLNGLISSTGAFSGTTDSRDNGVDTLNPTYGLLSGTINLSLNNAPKGETDLGTLGTGGATDDNSNLTIDFGLHRPMSIGNRVWYDTNNNGLMDGVENGVPGVTVNLYADTNKDGQPDGAALATTITDGSGYYLFSGLGEGSFVVRVESSNFAANAPLENLTSSTGNSTNNNDKNDNGIDNPTPSTNGILSNTITLTQNGGPTGETDLGTLGNGPNGETDANANLTVDFGFAGGSLSLGNRVWIDNGNGSGGILQDGIRNGSEAGVANVQIGLFRDTNSDGIPDTTTPIATTTTDANGYYLFSKLSPGQYVVQVRPVNFNGTGPLVGYGSTLTKTAGTDDNDNGIDNTNPGVNGIFSSTINLQTGTAPTGETDLGTLGTGGAADENSNLTVDFGFFKAMSIGNRVWFDTNNNGLMDTGENGIAGVTLTLYRDNGDNTFGAGDANVGTSTTDSLGYYLFDNLAPGNYFVQVNSTNFQTNGLLAGFTSSTGNTANNTDKNDNGLDDANAAANGIVSNLIALTQNAAPTGETDTSGNALRDGPFFRGNQNQSDNNSDLTIDFGFFSQPMSIGNRVWLDNGANGGTAGNGVRDGSEPGVANVVVGLYSDVNGDGQPDGVAVATTTTDANGYYLFDGLAPAKYVVRVEPVNFQSGKPLFGVVNSTGSTAGSDDHDNGIDNASPASTGVLSGPINLIANSTPQGETDLGPTGNGAHGETDQNANLTVDFGFNTSYDYGDAPDTYGTTNANSGANHVINSSIYLGKVVDAESNGQPNATANGDDTNGTAPDDEDGVTVPVFVVGTTQNVEVSVFNNTGNPATVALWVDFNGNGKFDTDTSEYFTATVPSAPASQIVQIPVIVPIGADVNTGGSTYLRVRLSTDSNAVSSPTGSAPDGEVEDYVATVNPPGLAITKTDSQNSIVVGQPTTYTITINNSGLDVINRNITDNPPTGDPNGFDPATITWTCTAQNGASCITGQPAGTGATGTGAINQNIDIPRSGTIVFTLTGTLRANYNQTTVTNTASLASGESSQDVDGVITDPGVGTKRGTVLSNTVIRWTMTWINTGQPQTATVTDPIPAGQTFIGNLTCTPFGSATTTTSCAFNNGVVTWNGTLGTGNANRLEISFDVRVSGDGNYQNSATIDIGGKTTSTAGTVNITNGSGGNTPQVSQPTIAKTVDAEIVSAGDPVDWTITVTNPNTTPLTNVQVTDNIPSALTILSVSTPTGQATVNGSTIAITIPTLNAGQSVAIVVHTRLNKNAEAGDIENIASFTGQYQGTAKATIHVVKKLPGTGEHPTPSDSSSLYRMALFGVILLGAALAVAFGIYRKRRYQ